MAQPTVVAAEQGPATFQRKPSLPATLPSPATILEMPKSPVALDWEKAIGPIRCGSAVSWYSRCIRSAELPTGHEFIQVAASSSASSQTASSWHMAAEGRGCVETQKRSLQRNRFPPPQLRNGPDSFTLPIANHFSRQCKAVFPPQKITQAFSHGHGR